MPDSIGPPSEFGGKVDDTGVQPLPHMPTPSERMMLLYTTGSEVGINPFTRERERDSGETMAGLLPLEVQTEIRRAEGVLEKGQVWEELQGAAALGEN